MVTGYTHGVIVDDVKSFDFASSYPYVITTMKFPSTKFKPLKIKRKEQMIDKFAYLIKVKFINISSKFYNNFISLSRCLDIENGRYDNGRVISADTIEIVLTDIDFNIICDSYDFDSYEFIEVYYSVYDYLPIELVQFTLAKYKIKTEYKNVEGKEVIYAIEKREIQFYLSE